MRFKQVHPSEPVYSARIGHDHCALAKRDGDTVTWFCIGSHAEYDNLLNQL